MADTATAYNLMVADLGYTGTDIPDETKTLMQAKLAAAGFTQTAITDALDQNGVLFPGGSLTEGDQTLTVKATLAEATD